MPIASHVAIIGCGQLSRMLALEGMRLGLRFSFVADAQEDTRCIDGFGTVVRWSRGDSIADLYQALAEPACITVEKEQVDLELVEALQAHCPVDPNPAAFAACQHRHREKQLLDRLSIPSASYVYNQPAAASVEELSLPVVVKSCRHGYDGKNQWVLKTAADVTAFDEQNEDDYIVEKWIPFDKEISQVSVRSQNGDILHYPLAENRHESGILKASIVPAPAISGDMAKLAQESLSRIMQDLDYVGVMAMECFVVGDCLLVNELAPRVHNSGHWTQQGSYTCQFENHMRAVCGLTLGDTRNHSVTGMLNLLGTKAPPLDQLAPTSTVHWYNKSVRPGRKLGHVNLTGVDHTDVQAQMAAFDLTD